MSFRWFWKWFECPRYPCFQTNLMSLNVPVNLLRNELYRQEGYDRHIIELSKIFRLIQKILCWQKYKKWEHLLSKVLDGNIGRSFLVFGFLTKSRLDLTAPQPPIKHRQSTELPVREISTELVLKKRSSLYLWLKPNAKFWAFLLLPYTLICCVSSIKSDGMTLVTEQSYWAIICVGNS